MVRLPLGEAYIRHATSHRAARQDLTLWSGVSRSPLCYRPPSSQPIKGVAMLAGPRLGVILSLSLAIPAAAAAQVDPTAAPGRPWIFPPGPDYRVPAPPGPAATQA